MRQYPYRFSKLEKEQYDNLVKEFYREGSFLKDAREKARSIVRGRILTEELELARKPKE